MTGKEAEVAVLKDRADRHRNDLKRAFHRLENIEGAQSENALERVRDEARQTEMGANIQALGASVEHAVTELQGAVNKVDKIDGRLQAIETSTKSIDARITSIEKKEVDLRKVLMWLGTKRGVFFMCFALVLLVGSFAPDARAFILEALGIVSSAGK